MADVLASTPRGPACVVLIAGAAGCFVEQSSRDRRGTHGQADELPLHADTDLAAWPTGVPETAGVSRRRYQLESARSMS